MTTRQINYYLVLFTYIQKKILAQFFIVTRKVQIKQLLIGNQIEQFFFLEKKKKLGIHIKEMETMIESH